MAIAAARSTVAALRERTRLRRHVGRLRLAAQVREKALRARESELSLAISGHEATLAELKRARHLVDAAQRSSGHFVAMMSHEIRTPLHGLMATIDMLRDEPLSPKAVIASASRACPPELCSTSPTIFWI